MDSINQDSLVQKQYQKINVIIYGAMLYRPPPIIHEIALPGSLWDRLAVLGFVVSIDHEYLYCSPIK